MECVNYEHGQQVTFPFEGKEFTGTVEVHQRMAGWVFVRADVGHEWGTLHAVRETQVKPAR